MPQYSFDLHNNNKYTLPFQEDVDFTFHINTFDYPIVHQHKDYWEFTIITDGHLINRLNNKDYLLSKNSLIVSSTKTTHQLIKPDKYKTENLRYINIIVRERRLEKILKSISPGLQERLFEKNVFFSFPENLAFSIENSLSGISLIDDLNPQIYNDIVCSSLLLIINFVLNQSLKKIHVSDRFSKELNEMMLSGEFIRMNIGELSKAVGYSRTQFVRLIKKHFNQTPHEFLVGYKIKYAEGLLVTSDMPLEKIVKAVGYSSQSSFIQNFKEKHGTSPNKYRKDMKIDQ